MENSVKGTGPPGSSWQGPEHYLNISINVLGRQINLRFAGNGCLICMGLNMTTIDYFFYFHIYILLDRCFEARSKIVTLTI